MSRILKRPMFRRGGFADTGIMDGFNTGGRVGFEEGTQETTPVFTEDPIVRKEYEDEPAVGLQDYISLFKLGAGIAGAPGRGDGLGGLLASASEPLQQAADEFAASTAAKAARKREFEQAEDARIDTAKREQKDREFDQFTSDVAFDRDLKIQAVKTEDELKIFDARVASGIDKTDYQRKEEDKNRIYNEMMSAKDETEYNRLKEQYEALYQDTVDARNSLREQILDNDELMGDGPSGIGFRGDAAKLVGTEGYEGMGLEQIAGELVNDYVEKTFKITVPSMPEFAEGGRVGLQEGGVTTQTMNQEPTSSAITFEELRSRLPREVSDSVVRLITRSEAALLDFAQIETQEDIARFNLKYNTDLQLPSQVA